MANWAWRITRVGNRALWVVEKDALPVMRWSSLTQTDSRIFAGLAAHNLSERSEEGLQVSVLLTLRVQRRSGDVARHKSLGLWSEIGVNVGRRCLQCRTPQPSANGVEVHTGTHKIRSPRVGLQPNSIATRRAFNRDLRDFVMRDWRVVPSRPLVGMPIRENPLSEHLAATIAMGSRSPQVSVGTREGSASSRSFEVATPQG